MEWTIPIQTFEVSKVKVGQLRCGTKAILPLSYQDTDFRFPYLSILLPLLTIKSYDPITGRLALDLEGAPAVATKLVAFQDMILAVMQQQQKTWFSEANVYQRSAQDLRNGFQSMIDGSILYLYCPSGTGPYGPCDVSLYTESRGWQQNMQRELLLPGIQIRVAFRLQGVSLHMSPQKLWTGRFRIQHRILTILSSDSLVRECV
jgi:hypothetical protein